MQEQLKLDEKWKEFDQNIFQEKNQFDTQLLHQRLQAILDSLKKPEQLRDIFGDVQSEDLQSGSLSTINMQFNTDTNEVKVTSEAVDKKGDPLYELVLDGETGVMRQIRRDAVSSHEKVVEKDI